jgi:6-phosphogluconolactonase
MNDMQVFNDQTKLAEAAAKQTVDILKTAIDTNGSATWVLAGGSTPLLAYKIIANNYADAIDWAKVAVIIGDERIGPLDGPDNNWNAIDQIIGNLPTHKLRPQSDKSASDAASDYQYQLTSLPTVDNGLPRWDLLWLGMGTDGHTLSLFPNHSSLLPNAELVIPVHDSPKPPLDRISLSLRAVQGAATVMVLITGEDKKTAVADALSGKLSPIGLVTNIVKTHGGSVHWLVDSTASTD